MAKRITNDDIIKINQVYLEKKTYAATARELGFSPSTIKKYVRTYFVDESKIEKKTFTLDDLPEFDPSIFRQKDWNNLCIMSDEEYEEVKKLWDEMTL